ncbi:alkaline phosphatase D family protein [Rhodothalassium salexigens]|uniref:alkaline phosphatase D family protein n=1 Tax=Rhodothalassium salexigens TaxID=1086 RepID=UPI00191468CC|nr:alkaline phosphatase D family protein [Rhodothalassium salexigens]
MSTAKGKGWTRRGFVGGVGVGAGTVALTGCMGAAPARFDHGIASGDPLADRVILWTRVTPQDPRPDRVPVRWQVALDRDFGALVASGEVTTGPERDFTVKVDAQGLKPGTTYYYRFQTGGVVSPTGTTKTLPTGGVEEVVLAFVSCSNYPQGYFHVYRELARRGDLDAVLHLGDYFYEYPAGGYADPAMVAAGRQVVPAHELVQLDDYRQRHALYKSDPDAQAVHARHPFIAVWDDHELANNAHWTGAQNHQADSEGGWAERRAAAVQAYREWMPIRDPADGDDPARTYRSFDFGGLATLIMLDTRLIGRDPQLSLRTDMVYQSMVFDFSNPDAPRAVPDPDEARRLSDAVKRTIPVPFETTEDGLTPITDFARIQALDPQNLPQGVQFLPDAERFRTEVLGRADRHMLGASQEAWLREELARSRGTGRPWQVLGQQVLMGRVVPPRIDPDSVDLPADSPVTRVDLAVMNQLSEADLPRNMDAWDGYPAARERVYDAIRQTGANALVLAGDTHNAWAFNLADAEGQAVAVEFGTASVSSPGMEAYLGLPHAMLEQALVSRNEQLVYLDAHRRGYAVLTLRPDMAETQFHYVSTVKAQRYEAIAGPRYRVRPGQPVLADA